MKQKTNITIRMNNMFFKISGSHWLEISLLLDEKFDNFMLTSSDSDTCFQVLAIHPHIKETTVEFMGHSQQHNNFVFLQ